MRNKMTSDLVLCSGYISVCWAYESYSATCMATAESSLYSYFTSTMVFVEHMVGVAAEHLVHTTSDVLLGLLGTDV